MTLEQLAAEVERLRDILEIQKLQARYQFYIGMNLGHKVAEIFAQTDPDVSAEIGDVGVWRGLESIKRVFGKLTLIPGKLGLIMALNPVIEVAKDGSTARGQWYGFGPVAIPTKATPTDEKMELAAVWMCGKYDMEYVKEDWKWKIKKLLYAYCFVTPFDKGWVKQPLPHGYDSFLKTPGGEPDGPATHFHPYGPEISEFIGVPALEPED